MSNPRQRLEAQLEVAALDLTQLDDAEADLLATLVDAARANQAAALRSGLEDTVACLPRLVRMPARKLVFG